ncbi:MAG: radical SAM-associated putative lipoprotein [Muribaculaceae bacterium]|nr:radical SAM-associated putative lipoprotein [Muribaculaceae bacterium]
MKLIDKRCSSLLSALCYALLSLLGFSCSSPGDIPDMYGMPTGDFEIKGAVTNEEGSPVSNAEIRVTGPDISSGVYSIQTTKTKPNGRYEAKGETFGSSQLKVVCVPADPMLEPDSVIVKMNYNKDKADSWYVGEAKETVDFKLKAKVIEEK